MHDSTRRLICRLVFVGLCLLPSGSLCAWIAYRASPIHAWRSRVAWQQTIYDLTGMQATIRRIRHPALTKTLLEDVVLIDPEGDQVVARIRVLEVTQNELGCVAVASQPEIEVGQLPLLSQRLQSRILQGRQPRVPTQFLAGEVTLLHGGQSITFTNVRCLTTSIEQSIQTTLEFQLAGFDHQSPAQLRVLRQRAAVPPSTLWELHTGSSPLPCSLFGDYLPALVALGPEAQFQGTAWFEQHVRGWDGEIAGRLSGINLESLVEPFPHKLSGQAELLLSHTTFREGRLVEAVGSLHSAGGVISRSLLASTSQAFGAAALASEAGAEDTLLAYRSMAFSFDASPAGLQVAGQCDPRQPGVILVGVSGEPLLVAGDALVPTAALTRALVPQSEFQVPATAATEVLLRILPLPEIDRPSTVTAGQNYPPLRLRD